MDGVEFDVHVRRGAGVTDIRRGEIRIVLQIIVSKSTSFVLPLFQCTVFKVNIIIVMGEVYCLNSKVDWIYNSF